MATLHRSNMLSFFVWLQKYWDSLTAVAAALQVSIGCPEKMEPITKVSHIPASRWALSCSLCREHTGTCIQVQHTYTGVSSVKQQRWGEHALLTRVKITFVWEVCAPLVAFLTLCAPNDLFISTINSPEVCPKISRSKCVSLIKYDNVISMCWWHNKVINITLSATNQTLLYPAIAAATRKAPVVAVLARCMQLSAGVHDSAALWMLLSAQSEPTPTHFAAISLQAGRRWKWPERWNWSLTASVCVQLYSSCADCSHK